MGTKATLTLPGLLVLLTGCAGSDAHLRLLESENAVSVEPSQSRDFDYLVKIRGALDFGYNPSNPETRKETALRAVAAQCPTARIVGEQAIQKGRDGANHDYFIQIRCDGAASVAEAQPTAPTRKKR